MCHQLVQPKLTFTLQHAMFSVKVRQKLPAVNSCLPSVQLGVPCCFFCHC